MSRVLLDHSVPDGLRRLLPGHAVSTAYDEGWDRLGNGDLLTQAEAGGFAVLVTADRNMRHQQNLAGRRIALVVLPTNRWKTVREHAERIARAVNQARPGSFAEVAFAPQPRRPKGPGP